jgi:hypothetical protein
VTVIADGGRQWNVSPSLLRWVGSFETAETDTSNVIRLKETVTARRSSGKAEVCRWSQQGGYKLTPGPAGDDRCPAADFVLTMAHSRWWLRWPLLAPSQD